MSTSEQKRKNKRSVSGKFSRSLNFDLDEILTKGEEVIAIGNVHWGIYWKAWAVLIIALLVAVFLVVELGVILGIFGALLLIYAIIKKHMLLLILTNKRVLARYGILQVDVVDIRFRNIESVEMERMLPAFLMGYSSVIIMGTGNRYIYIPYIGNGIAFRRAYNELVFDDEDVSEEAKTRAKKVKDEVGDDPGLVDE